jgi:putative endonuclease
VAEWRFALKAQTFSKNRAGEVLRNQGLFMSGGSWHVYIAQCKDGTYYTGITKDVERRIKEHNTTNKCRYTRYRKPLKLVYSETSESYNAARKREKEIKDYSRDKKEKLMANK